MKKILKMPAVLFIMFLMALYFFFPWEKKVNIEEQDAIGNSVDQPIPQIANVEEKLSPINKYLGAKPEEEKKKQEILEELRKDPEFHSSIEKYFEPLVTFSETLLADINFYGQVVDQYGDPVANHKIIYNTVGAIYAEGTGPGETMTDENGRFLVSGVRARTLYIESAKKNGYQFPIPKYLKHEVFLNATENNPYIIHAWKIDRYPNINQGNIINRFISDGRTYTLNFLEKKISQEGDNLEGDLRITFDADDHDWSVKIEAINGGLQETNDLYRYLAPINGYQSSLTYEGFENDNRAQRIRKNIYFTSRNNEMYGTINMTLWPYRRNNTSNIRMKYVVNLEQGRNLTVKK